MKIQIKTLYRKSVVIDIEPTKTVHDLKKELSLYAEVGVRPEFQKLIYSGQILANEEKLSTYNIDVKKFLVVLILKQPSQELPQSTKKQKQSNTNRNEKTNEKGKVIDKETPECSKLKTPTNSGDPKKEKLASQIVDMGYPDADVRRALAASFYNPERAIQYLIEGIPPSPSTPEGESGFTTADSDLSKTPFEIMRTDPAFQKLRDAIQQNPEVVNQALKKISETNPALLRLIDEHHDEFLSMLIEGSDDDDDEDFRANLSDSDE